MGTLGRGKVGHLAVALCAIVVLAGPTSAGASGGWYDWPDMKKCDQFRAGDVVIKAYASKATEAQEPLSCRKANRIMRVWWKAPDSDVHHHAGGGYYTLDGFPGWRCDSGAGGGACTHGDKTAGYQNRIA